MTEDDYAPFLGDGRRKVSGFAHIPGTHPVSVTVAAARQIIDRLKATGVSIHSRQGGTLWVILQWCAHNNVSYMLNAKPGFGYQITLGEPND